MKTLIKIFASLTLKQYLIIIFIIQIDNHKDAFVNIEYGIHFFSPFLVLFNVSRDQKYFSFKSRKKIKWKIKRKSLKLNLRRQIKVPNISHHFSMSAFYINGKTSLFIPSTTLTSEKNNTGFGKWEKTIGIVNLKVFFWSGLNHNSREFWCDALFHASDIKCLCYSNFLLSISHRSIVFFSYSNPLSMKTFVNTVISIPISDRHKIYQ